MGERVIKKQRKCNFENDLTPGVLESGQIALADALAVKAKECTSAKFDGQ